MASGDTLIRFTAYEATYPTTEPAFPGMRNEVPVMWFEDGQDTRVEFSGFMPRYYDSGGVTATLGWMAETATSGNCRWEVAWKSVTDDADDLDTKSFASAQNATDAAASASGEVAYHTDTFTDGAQIDSVAAGEYFRLEVFRNGNHGQDSINDDVQLIFVELRET